MRLCPNAILLAHPRAVPHLVDPAKLVASAKKVYGDQRFEELYGKIDPIPAARVRAMEDGEELECLSGSQGPGVRARFIHTRGHANHHFCILIETEGRPAAVFTGDSFGLAYPDLQQNGLFIFPSTSPTDFDPEQARISVGRIRDTGAPVAYPTHFGAVREIEQAARQLLDELGFSEGLLNEAVASSQPDSALDAFCETRLRAHFEETFARRGMPWSERARQLLDLDLKLNAAGIAHVARKRRGTPK